MHKFGFGGRQFCSRFGTEETVHKFGFGGADARALRAVSSTPAGYILCKVGALRVCRLMIF